MLKKITSSFAVCALLTCFHTSAEEARHLSPCQSDNAEILVQKKLRTNMFSLAVLTSPKKLTCESYESEKNATLLETVETKALLHKKLPESLLASAS